MNVALIIFNRPDLTERVFSEIARARPSKLFVIADGPRRDRPDDAAQCAAARQVIERVDWPCDVFKNYSDTNLGCGLRPASGITWVFEHVDNAIILEDDCVPNQSFFRFCDELLQRYADDERVAQISGNHLQFGQRRGTHSYFFSRYNVCAGGFATWRRSWKHFDLQMSYWPTLRDTGWLTYTTGSPEAERLWRGHFDLAHQSKGNVSFWDYQWSFACLLQNGLSAIPNAGLLSNLGFRPDGTHTHSPSRWANLPMEELTFPLDHPPYVIPHAEADAHFVAEIMTPPARPPLNRRVARRINNGLRAAKRAALGLFA